MRDHGAKKNDPRLGVFDQDLPLKPSADVRHTNARGDESMRVENILFPKGNGLHGRQSMGR
jgi:hypothetical protein